MMLYRMALQRVSGKDAVDRDDAGSFTLSKKRLYLWLKQGTVW